MRWGIERPRRGVLGPYRKSISSRYARAAARATDRAATGARDELRQAMRGQRLGGLANTIGSTSDLKKQRAPAELRPGFDVAGFVFARIRSQRTAGALAAYVDNETTTITPSRAKWLAIATREIRQTVGRRRMTPERYREAGLEERIGKLQFIRGPTASVAYLVVPDTTISTVRAGRPRRVPKNGRLRAGRARVGLIAFVLIRQTRRSRRVAPRQIARRWALRLPELITNELARR